MKRTILMAMCGLTASLAQAEIPDSLLMDEVVVTGTRNATDVRHLPMTVTVIGRDRLTVEHQPSVLPTVMREVPGLFLTSRAMMGYGVSTGAAGGINLRGIAGGADHPKRAMVAARKVIDDVLSSPIAADDLKASKALLSNVYSLYLSDPDSYLDAVMLRYSGGKDVLTDYQKRIGSVTADNVKHIFGVLTEGMKIEYVVKQQ